MDQKLKVGSYYLTEDSNGPYIFLVTGLSCVDAFSDSSPGVHFTFWHTSDSALFYPREGGQLHQSTLEIKRSKKISKQKAEMLINVWQPND